MERPSPTETSISGVDMPGRERLPRPSRAGGAGRRQARGDEHQHPGAGAEQRQRTDRRGAEPGGEAPVLRRPDRKRDQAGGEHQPRGGGAPVDSPRNRDARPEQRRAGNARGPAERPEPKLAAVSNPKSAASARGSGNTPSCGFTGSTSPSAATAT